MKLQLDVHGAQAYYSLIRSDCTEDILTLTKKIGELEVNKERSPKDKEAYHLACESRIRAQKLQIRASQYAEAMGRLVECNAEQTVTVELGDSDLLVAGST